MNYTYFWGGEFSQWWKSDFVINGVKYNTAEQYMMACKAHLFGDYETLGKIMSTTNPRAQKALGRKVDNFDPVLWNTWCRKFVYDANYAKFTQNPELRKVLEKTIGTLLVEASPEDVVWGIGLAPDDEDRHDRSKWKGTNYLGQVITVLRLELYNYDKDIEVGYDESLSDYYKWKDPQLCGMM